MPGTHERDLDLLAMLHEDIERFLEALAATDASTGYLEGQIAYLEAAAEAIGRAAQDRTPREVLDGVAAELGLRMEDGRIEPVPTEPRGAGILSMWSLCLGYVEGAKAGVHAAVDELEGVEGSTRER